MNFEVFLKIIKRKSTSEIIIDWIFVLVGGFLVYDAIYFIYAYHFGSILFLFMVPMTTLISKLVLGLAFLGTGLNSIKNGKKTILFEKDYRLNAVVLSY
ncbi:hypothetical protein [Marinifilum fragile]|uniref:hypothetical protein n=1 Tax=Marinifilum fragile TaxID=570161 RepID=UPI002AAA67B9|nr:hypothetical protein [Marinifilum fragile]